MKKIIFLAALAFFLIIIAIMPLFVGIAFKHQYFDFISAISQNNKIKITVLAYKRGWFHSTATIQITPVFSNSSTIAERAPILSPEEILTLTTVRLDQSISHGPIVMDKIHGHPTFAMAGIENIVHSKDIEQVLNKNSKTNGLLLMHSIFNFSGDVFNHLVIPPLEYTDQQLGALKWQGLTLDLFFHMNHQKKINKVSTGLIIGALTAKSEIFKFNFNMQPITAQSRTERQSLGLWTGESDATMPSLIINDGFTLDTLICKTKATLAANNLYRFSSELSLNKLLLPNESIQSISALNFKIDFNGLNANEILNAIQKINALENSGTPRDELEKQYLQTLVHVITPSTSINITGTSDTSLGKFDMKASVYWPASVPAPTTPDDVYANTSAKIDIRMAMPLAQELVKIAANNLAETSARNVSVPATTSPTIAVTTHPADAAKNAFSQKIADLLRAGKISLPVSLQIMGWWDQQIPADIFASNIKQFGLAPDAENNLVQTYIQLKKSAPVASATSQTGSVSMPPTQQQKDQMQQLLAGNILQTIDQWLTKGYLTQDGNDYVIEITREAGVIKLNGKDLPPDLPVPVLGAVPSAP